MTDHTKTVDSYIVDASSVRFKPFNEIYADAVQELIQPFPATPINAFPEFSRAIGGFRSREFSILCGATGVGKTTLIANWSSSWVAQGIPHFVASVETGHTDFVKRVLSCFAGKDWNTGDPVNLDAFRDFAAKHAPLVINDKLALSLYDDRFSVKQLMNDIAFMVKTRGVKIALIDNLNFFLEVKRSADQIVEMDRVIHDLIIFCKQVDVHIVMVMHPKKGEGGNNRVESEYDIKGSSTAVQEAHNVFLFNRSGKDLVDSGLSGPNDREIKIAKMRRKGRLVGTRFILKCSSGVSYKEGGMV